MLGITRQQLMRSKIFNLVPVMNSVLEHRAEIKKILSGQDKRLLIIVGPCSAWPATAVKEYADRLVVLQKAVADKFKIIMRVYVQKSRTRTGWLGPFFQPDPLGAANIPAGTKYTQTLFKEIVKRDLPIATEIVFPQTAHDFEQYVAWGAVGARCSENPEHRIFASGADYPIGLKNVTSGDLDISMNSVFVAQQSGVWWNRNKTRTTSGNNFAHLVLRGGARGANFDLASIRKVVEIMQRDKIKNPAILIDASHGNSRAISIAKEQQQAIVLKKIFQLRRSQPLVKKILKGVMIESFIKAGAQNLLEHNKKTLDRSGLSLTDPCLGWKETEAMVKKIYELY